MEIDTDTVARFAPAIAIVLCYVHGFGRTWRVLRHVAATADLCARALKIEPDAVKAREAEMEAADPSPTAGGILGGLSSFIPRKPAAVVLLVLCFAGCGCVPSAMLKSADAMAQDFRVYRAHVAPRDPGEAGKVEALGDALEENAAAMVEACK